MRSGTPYLPDVRPVVTVSFFNISGTQVGSTYTSAVDNRLLHCHTFEEPFTGKATIRLDNHDGALNTLDFTGCITAITWGWTGGTPSTDQPYWVTDQEYLSQEGKMLVELKLVPAWGMLEFSCGANEADSSDPTDPTFGSTRVWERDTTILDIITEIVSAAGGFLAQWSLGSVTQLTDDGIIDVYMPYVFTRINESDQYLLRRLLRMTESVITFRASTGTTINWIDQSLPGPFYTYEAQTPTTDHPFLVRSSGESKVIPNRIIYVDQEPDINKDQVANFVGVAELATFPLGKFGHIEVDPSIGYPHSEPPTAGEITAGNTEATLRADSHLQRLQNEAFNGEIYVPMNCCAELYDEVEIIDNRTGTTHYGRIGQIERLYQSESNDIEKPKSSRESYVSRIKLGGLGGGSTRIENFAGGANDIDTTISDLKTRSMSNPFVDTYQIDRQILSQHLSPIIFRKPATADGTFNSGVLADITGCTKDITVLVDSVLDLTVNAFVGLATAPAAGDSFDIALKLDGVVVSGVLRVKAFTAAADQNRLASKRWLIALTKGTHTIKVTGQRITGAATWTVFGAAGQTDMVGLVVSNRLSSGAV